MSTPIIFAGIDEAGYGPLLGPLVLGRAAVRVEVEEADELPDLWAILKEAVSQKRDRTGRRLHVNDSKKVYSPSKKTGGLKELERAVLATAGASGVDASSLDALLTAVHPDAAKQASGIDWFTSPADEQHPHDLDPASAGIATNALKHACERANVTFLSPAAQVIFEPEYNRLCGALQNKAAMLQTVLARLIYGTIDPAREPVTLVIDRQGGRSHYAGFLRQMFGDWELSVVSEDDARAEYTMTRGDQSARLIFSEKAESIALPTALASMYAKYLRERLMGRFNAWWATHDPSLQPTAGYWTDAQRWLEDTAELRQRLRIPDAQLIRER